MLTQTLLRFTLLGEDWILYILFALSLTSVAVMLERAAYFGTRGLANVDALTKLLLSGDFDGARKALDSTKGMEGEVLRAALGEAPKGSAAVEEVIARGIARQRMFYERSLAFLGTLGNNAPFVGLLGTVLGIIRAFQDLAAGRAGDDRKGPQTVMAGSARPWSPPPSGLFVALPAVVAFNSFQRWLKTITSRTNILGHALVANLAGAGGSDFPGIA